VAVGGGSGGAQRAARVIQDRWCAAGLARVALNFCTEASADGDPAANGKFFPATVGRCNQVHGQGRKARNHAFLRS